eukprot:6194600-Pleurochrysis_carterae.AAC.3
MRTSSRSSCETDVPRNCTGVIAIRARSCAARALPSKLEPARSLTGAYGAEGPAAPALSIAESAMVTAADERDERTRRSSSLAARIFCCTQLHCSRSPSEAEAALPDDAVSPCLYPVVAWRLAAMTANYSGTGANTVRKLAWAATTVKYCATDVQRGPLYGRRVQVNSDSADPKVRRGTGWAARRDRGRGCCPHPHLDARLHVLKDGRGVGFNGKS